MTNEREDEIKTAAEYAIDAVDDLVEDDWTDDEADSFYKHVIEHIKIRMSAHR